METRTMAGVTYVGRGVIKITLGHLTERMRKQAERHGYAPVKDNTAMYKYVDHLDWGIEIGWILTNKEQFDPSNLELFLNNIDSIERSAMNGGDFGSGGQGGGELEV